MAIVMKTFGKTSGVGWDQELPERENALSTQSWSILLARSMLSPTGSSPKTADQHAKAMRR
jgi:hypothetical protein